jgi:hypothetical protein
MISLPGAGRKWQLANNSDLFGNIYVTKCMNFAKEGYAKLARKPMAIYTTDSDSNFDRIVAITGDSDFNYIVTTDRVYTLAPSETTLSVVELTSTNMPNTQNGSDGVIYKGVPVVTGNTKAGSYAATAWTDRLPSLSSSYPHPLAVFENRNTLCVANGNVVYQTSTDSWSDDSSNALTIPSKYIITSMRWKGNSMYIGTRTISGENALVFVWNGSGTSAQAAYGIGADWAYSLCEYGSSVAVLTSAGQCLRFNGGGFSILFNLPIWYTSLSWGGNIGTSSAGKCLNRGMYAIGDVLYFNIDGTPAGGNEPLWNQPSGLWVFDPKVGPAPYHKAGYVSEKYKDLSLSSISSNEVVLSAAHGAQTGDALWASSVSNVVGMTTGIVYYAIVTGTTTLKVALSAADALAERHIDISGTPSGDKFAFDNLTSVANVFDVDPGPVYPFRANQINQFFGSDIFFGGSSSDPDGNSISALMSFGLGRNVGSFTTPRLPAEGVLDSLKSLLLAIQGINLPTDSVVVKYRTSRRFGLPTPVRTSSGGRALMVDGDQFTVDSTLKDIKAVQVGDEVDFVQGACAGYTAHITEIDDNTSEYAYTIDESLVGGVAGDLAEVVVDNWTKVNTDIDSDLDTIEKEFAEIPLDEGAAAWVQFKVELRGFEVSINMMRWLNAVHKNIE